MRRLIGRTHFFLGDKKPGRPLVSTILLLKPFFFFCQSAWCHLLLVNMTSADISDAAGAQKVLDALRIRWPWVKHLFADSAYDRTMLMDKAATQDFVVEVVRKMKDQHGFIPLSRRWVVERTFGWMMHWRRLVRDYERRIDVSETMIYVAMSDLLLKRLFE